MTTDDWKPKLLQRRFQYRGYFCFCLCVLCVKFCIVLFWRFENEKLFCRGPKEDLNPRLWSWIFDAENWSLSKKKTKQNHEPFHDLSACTQSQWIMMNYSTNVVFPFRFKVSHEVDDHVKIRIFYIAFLHFMIDLSEVWAEGWFAKLFKG